MPVAAVGGTSGQTAREPPRLRAGLAGGLKGLFLGLLPAIWLLTPMGVATPIKGSPSPSR